MAEQWFNADGLKVDFGRENGLKTFFPYSVKSFGSQKEVIFKFDLGETAAGTTYTTDRDNDGTTDGFNTGDFFIPNEAIIDSADVYMKDEAGAGGTSVELGTYAVDGTAIDDNGLVTAANGATANLTANAKVTGSGALVGAGVTADSYLALKVTGTFTAGQGLLVVRYTDTSV